MARNAVTAFGIDLVERAAKSGAQAALAVIGLEHIHLATGGWTTVGYAAASGFILSVLTSVASIPVGNTESPSVVRNAVSGNSSIPSATESTNTWNTPSTIRNDVSAMPTLVNTNASTSDVLAAGNAIFPV